jgi:hypothetical protein
MSRTLSMLSAGVLLGALCNPGLAAEPTSTSSAAAVETRGVADLLEAESQDLVSVRYIANDSRSAQIIVTNKTRRPLTLQLPAAFAGVPVLAQMGGMGGMGGGQAGGFGQGGIGGQSVGGGRGGMGGMGGGGMGGMGGGGMGGMGGGAFSIPPERSRVLRVTTVCLEHGKPEPTSRMPYKLVRVEAFSSDPRLDLVLQSLGRGELSQRVAQAAAWHIANGLSWEKLAAEKIDHVGGNPDEPFFSQAELVAAHRVVAVVTEQAARRPAATATTSSSSASAAASSSARSSAGSNQ